MRNKLEVFIEKSIKRHGNKYDYSKVDYKDSTQKVLIICPEHGEFWQTPAGHVRGNTCPKCANLNRGAHTLSTEELIKRCQKVHKGKYDYSKTKYVNSETKICITCPVHGDFYMLPSHHISGQCCPKCQGRNLTTEDIIKLFRDKHGDTYDYSKMKYVKAKQKVCIICRRHGEFWQTPEKHLRGQGCPVCGGRMKSDKETFIEKANIVHADKYCYDNVNYVNNRTNVEIICPSHGPFMQLPLNHLHGHGCPKCVETTSADENVINGFLSQFNLNILQNDRNIISPYELDLYIPDKKIAIEYDGLYWHSTVKTNANYHLMKTELCEKLGIKLIHIFEDEWIYKQDIVKSRLLNALNLTPNRIYARNCIIKRVPYSECKNFLDNNHIQGNVNSKYRYGLYYNDELVSIMTFGSKRKSLGSKSEDNTYEMLRFCNRINLSVVGGASKLLKHFIDVVNPKEIISYCDRRWSNGKLYEKLGFKFSHVSKPNYFYVVGKKRENRFKYRKSELLKEGFDKNLSEREIMEKRGFKRIYDCGTKVYMLNQGNYIGFDTD